MLSSIDWGQFPAYLIILFYVLYAERNRIIGGINKIWKNKEDEREHTQEIEALEFNFKAQDKATQRAREHELDSVAFSILREMIKWMREDFDRMDEELRKIRLVQQRQNDLFTLHNKLLSNLFEKKE